MEPFFIKRERIGTGEWRKECRDGLKWKTMRFVFVFVFMIVGFGIELNARKAELKKLQTENSKLKTQREKGISEKTQRTEREKGRSEKSPTDEPRDPYRSLQIPTDLLQDVLQISYICRGSIGDL